jgi:Flp pilus assembly protein TadB
MIDTTTTALPRFIGMLLAPMFMVSGSASMNWGLQRLQSMLTARIHKLNDERSELQNEMVPTAFSKMRQQQISTQLQSMMRRARYTRNAIASFYAACLSLLLCSVSIAAVAWLDLEATWVCTILFELGMLLISVALVYTLLDVGLSYHAVQVDSKAARDSAEMVGVNV